MLKRNLGLLVNGKSQYILHSRLFDGSTVSAKRQFRFHFASASAKFRICKFLPATSLAYTGCAKLNGASLHFRL